MIKIILVERKKNTFNVVVKHLVKLLHIRTWKADHTSGNHELLGKKEVEHRDRA